jgi:ABC-2 type transport system permease protein
MEASAMREIKFLLAIWKTNLLSIMEFRVSFLTQVIGMILNDFIYFAIWIIFFKTFNEVRGWGIDDMYITYGVQCLRTGGSPVRQCLQPE